MAYKHTCCIYKDLNVSIQNISIYTSESMKEIVLSLETELIKKNK
jgi:hypothetical protein